MTPSLLLPLCFVDTANINNGFDGNFANAQLQDWQSSQCYFQKWKFSDSLRLQLISDEELDDLIIYNLDGSVADTVIWEVLELSLPSFPDFSIYEIDYSFANLSAGKYIIQQNQFEAEPIEVAQDFPDTILLTYKHSQNDYSVVFSAGFEMMFRVEGWIGNYKPKNERDVYPDQRRNLTQLNSVAYRQFSLYIGYKWGVHQKFLDKVNQITQCDQLSIDGVGYQPLSDADFEVENNIENNYIGGSIDIEPVTNNFNRIATSANPNATYTPNQMVTPYLNKLSDFTVSGLFRFASVLEYIAIYRTSPNPLTIKFGTNNGDNDIGEIIIDGLQNTLLVDYLFNATTTVYVSGISDGDDVSIYFIWKQLDALPIPINPNPATNEELGKGAVILWFEATPGDFLLNWDLATGLGKANTKWTKWCVLGTNGTISSNEAYFRQIDWSNIVDNYLTLGTVIGANQKLIPRSALPAEALKTLSNDVNPNPGDTPTPFSRVSRGGTNGASLAYELRAANSAATVGLTDNMGNGETFDVTPKTVISLYIFKLQD